MDRVGMISQAAAGVTLVGLLASWIVLLGGLSAVQKSCNGGCRSVTGLSWWILWFQFLVLFLMPAVVFVEGLAHGRTAIIALMAVLATLQMYETDLFLDYRSGAINIDNSRVDTAATGMLLLAFFNLLGILCLGFSEPGGGGAAQEGDPYASGTTTYSNPVAKSGGTNASGAAPANGGNMRPLRTASRNMGTMPASPPPAV